MKIVKKIFSMLLLLIVGCFATSVSAASTAPSSFTISASDLQYLYGSTYLGHGSTLNFTYKTNTDGKVVYCTEIHDTMTTSQETYTYSKEASSAITNILANGYPNKSITGDSKKDYYITGLAIWYVISPSDSTFTYFNLDAGTYKGYSSDVVKEVAKLVKTASSSSSATPSMKLNNSSTTLTLSSDSKYYVSQKMTVSGTALSGNYTVSLSNAPTGSIVTDSNGNAKTSFSVGEGFIVKVPASSVTGTSASVKVEVSATGSVYKAYIYAPTYASHQGLTALYPENIDLKDSTTLSLTKPTAPVIPDTPKTGKVTISKLDIANDEELEGATLVVKDSNGKVIDTWVSGKTPHVITGLSFGTYTLTETIAPDGYVKSEETITFTISEDNLEASAVMYNSAEVPTKVIISKQDITNGEELPGAHLVLKDKDGNIIDEWVSGDTPHEIEGLEAGKTYILTETIAPDGYVLNEESIEFTVNDDGTVTTIVMYNAPTEIIEEVPKTSAFKTAAYSLIGIVVIAIGSLIIFRNVKENEL